MRYAALLRAVNVGTGNRLSMERLKELCQSLGFSAVSTYLQSGNAVFEADSRTDGELEASIEGALASELKLEVRVIVLSEAELAGILHDNPFPGEGLDTEKLHVTLFKTNIENADPAKLENKKSPSERYQTAKRHLYLYCPGGYGKTRLGNSALEKWSNTAATTRNWKTMNAIAALMREV